MCHSLRAALADSLLEFFAHITLTEAAQILKKTVLFGLKPATQDRPAVLPLKYHLFWGCGKGQAFCRSVSPQSEPQQHRYLHGLALQQTELPVEFLG